MKIKLESWRLWHKNYSKDLIEDYKNILKENNIIDYTINDRNNFLFELESADSFRNICRTFINYYKEKLLEYDDKIRSDSKILDNILILIDNKILSPIELSYHIIMIFGNKEQKEKISKFIH